MDNMSFTGTVSYNGTDLRTWRNLYSLRRRVGVVFPLPVGLPMSIYENVAFSPRIRGIKNKAGPSMSSSRSACAGQRCGTRSKTVSMPWQLVVRRTAAAAHDCPCAFTRTRLAVARRVLHCRGPCHDVRIEDVLKELREELTIVLVTNLVQQCRQLADRSAFFLQGVRRSREHRGLLHRRGQRPTHTRLCGGSFWITNPPSLPKS